MDQNKRKKCICLMFAFMALSTACATKFQITNLDGKGCVIKLSEPITLESLTDMVMEELQVKDNLRGFLVFENKCITPRILEGLFRQEEAILSLVLESRDLLRMRYNRSEKGFVYSCDKANGDSFLVTYDHLRSIACKELCKDSYTIEDFAKEHFSERNFHTLSVRFSPGYAVLCLIKNYNHYDRGVVFNKILVRLNGDYLNNMELQEGLQNFCRSCQSGPAIPVVLALGDIYRNLQSNPTKEYIADVQRHANASKIEAINAIESNPQAIQPNPED